MFNKTKSFIAIFFACLFLFIGLATPCVAHAADAPPWFSSASNVVIDLVDDTEYLNDETATALFEYFDYLYYNNMTDGMQLFAFNLSTFGGGNTTGAAGKTTLTLYFNNPDRPILHAYRSSSNLIVVNGVTGESYNGYSTAYPLLFGNFKITSMNTTGTISSFFAANQFYGYRDRQTSLPGMPGVMTIGGSYVTNNEAAGNNDVLPWLIQSKVTIESWIGSSGSGDDVSSGDPVVLDFGSIISAVMTAPMIMFGGLTGSPGNLENSLILFGIDIRLTLISLLVIAIVVFIIKFLRGG